MRLPETTKERVAAGVATTVLAALVFWTVSSAQQLLATPRRMDALTNRVEQVARRDSLSIEAVKTVLDALNRADYLHDQRLRYNVEQTNRVLCMVLHPSSVSGQVTCIMEENRRTGVSPQMGD